MTSSTPMHGPAPRWHRDLEAQRAEDLRADKYDETVDERAARRMLDERRSCRLPASQRLSEATRVGRCRMAGVDPYPDGAPVEVLQPRPLVDRRAA